MYQFLIEFTYIMDHMMTVMLDLASGDSDYSQNDIEVLRKQLDEQRAKINQAMFSS